MRAVPSRRDAANGTPRHRSALNARRNRAPGCPPARACGARTRLDAEQLALAIVHVIPQRALAHRRSLRAQQASHALRQYPPLQAQQRDDVLATRIQASRSPRPRPVFAGLLQPHRTPHRLEVQAQATRALLLRHLDHETHVADLGPLRHSDHLLALRLGFARRTPDPPRYHTAGPPPALVKGVPFQRAAKSLFRVPATAGGLK